MMQLLGNYLLDARNGGLKSGLNRGKNIALTDHLPLCIGLCPTLETSRSLPHCREWARSKTATVRRAAAS